jgi:GntR family transcriptional regulator, transcriptional repressor for pyruvate dehydrogenase complex
MAYSPIPIQRESVITRAADEICRFIEGQRLNDGDALPTETRLAEMLHISRNSLREALRILHGLGVVEKSAGKRVVVRTVPGKSTGVHDEAALREAAPIAHWVRLFIEEKCAELAAERITDAELAAMETKFASLEQAVKRKDIPAAIEAHEAFHASVVASAKNPHLASLFNQARQIRMSNISAAVRKTFADRKHLQQNKALLDALRQRDPRCAAAAVRTHYVSVTPIIELTSAPKSSLVAADLHD